MNLDGRISIDAVQEHTCSISFDTIGELAQEQQKKGLPFVIAAVNKRVEDVAAPLLSNVDKFDFFDACKLNHHIRITEKYENPNDRQEIKRITYLWNGILGKKSEPFQIDSNSFSILQEINGHIDQNDEAFEKITTLAAACQHEDKYTQLSAQITLAQELWEDKPEESVFWIQNIHNSFSTIFLQARYYDLGRYADQLRGLYQISRNSLIYSCLCISELRSNFCIDTAINAFLEKNPEDILALTLKGVLYAFGGLSTARDRERAEQYLVQVLHNNHEIGMAWLALIECNTLKAYELLQQFVTCHPENPLLLTHLAILLSQGRASIPKDLDRAHHLLTRAIELNPDYAAAHAELGTLLRTGGTEMYNVQQARYHLLKACELDPRLLNAHVQLGELLRVGGDGVSQDLEGAYVHLTKAIELCPTLAFAHAQLGEILRTGGGDVPQNRRGAYYHLMEAIRLNPSDDFAHASLGGLLSEEGDEVPRDRKRAYNHLTKAIDLNPRNASAHFWLGALLMREGDGIQKDLKKAHDHLVVAVDLNPEDTLAHSRLGSLLLFGGDGVESDIEKARYHFEQAKVLRKSSE